ncbi:MAG TPA: aldo/keto reductase [Candidatus Dormibacteraeota bacterium]|jgi:aryl-alcohol dehydrogenase-like predicted oxidoreductase|nr:aldo/keto reductase [Candidatus Dormibacteraeota bacterium]
MRKITLGRTGLEVPPIGLGGYPFSGVNRARGWDPYSEEGRRTAIRTVNAALDRGVTYIDTAPAYGDGHSETLIGEVMAARRDECVLATKVGWRGMDGRAVTESVQASLRRLRTDHVDVIQFHGGVYTDDDRRHILEGGPLEALRRLREQGQVRFIGLTTEEPHSCLGLLQTDAFDVAQLAYNVIYQGAALHALPEARRRDVGVVTMRSMTSGVLQRLLPVIAPEWEGARDSYQVCLRFLLADSRVHVANIGMRWPEEVERNVALVESFQPEADLADLPRMTAAVYRALDEEAAG